MAHNRDLMVLTIQSAINISAIPMAFVNKPACAVPNIFATISWCRGTRLSSLQNRPLINQTNAMRYVKRI